MEKKIKTTIIKSKKRDKDILAEIGFFVVEFESLQKEVKEFIVDCFDIEKLNDTNLIEIVLYQASSYELTEYFRGIALYQVSKMEPKYKKKEEISKIHILKEYINIASKNLAELATLRNDLLHSNFDTHTETEYEGENIKILRKFQGRRSKIKAKGIELKHITIEPGVFFNIFDAIIVLKFCIQQINELINSDYFETFQFNKEMLMVYKEIDVFKERNKLFKDKEGFYLNKFEWNQGNKARLEYFASLERN
jgi:hypothetical protein